MSGSNKTISMFDISHFFWENKWIGFVIFTLTVLIGVAIAFILPRQYKYTQNFQLAHYTVNKAALHFLQTQKAVVGEIDNVVIPKVLRPIIKNDPKSIPLYLSLKTKSLDDNAGLIRVTDVIPEKKVSVFTDLAVKILAAQVAFEAPRISRFKNGLNNELQEYRQEYAQVENSLALDRAQLAVVKQQFGDVKRLFMNNSKQLAAKKFQTSENNTTDLMRNQFYGSEIAQFRHLLYSNLSPHIQSFEAKILKLTNRLSQLKLQEAMVQNELTTFVPTTMSGSVIRSLKPVSTPRMLILTLSVFMGLVFALFGMILAGFIKYNLKNRR